MEYYLAMKYYWVIKKVNLNSCSNMNETGGDYDKQNKPEEVWSSICSFLFADGPQVKVYLFWIKDFLCIPDYCVTTARFFLTWSFSLFCLLFNCIKRMRCLLFKAKVRRFWNTIEKCNWNTPIFSFLCLWLVLPGLQTGSTKSQWSSCAINSCLLCYRFHSH